MGRLHPPTKISPITTSTIWDVGTFQAGLLRQTIFYSSSGINEPRLLAPGHRSWDAFKTSHPQRNFEFLLFYIGFVATQDGGNIKRHEPTPEPTPYVCYATNELCYPKCYARNIKKAQCLQGLLRCYGRIAPPVPIRTFVSPKWKIFNAKCPIRNGVGSPATQNGGYQRRHQTTPNVTNRHQKPTPRPRSLETTFSHWTWTVLHESSGALAATTRC